MENLVQNKSAEPYNGIWLRFARTLESTVARSSYARPILSLPEFLAERPTWTPAGLAFLQTALEHLYASQGQTPISSLAVDCGLSLRQFERRFKQRIGVSPKVFARLLRFESLLHSLIHAPASPSSSGYQDQAHVIREFKTWAGCTPTEFLARAKQRSQQGPLLPDPRPVPLSISFNKEGLA